MSHDDARVTGASPAGQRPFVVGADHSPNAWVCPFLRALDDTDRLGAPDESPSPMNRCAALPDFVPQSLRQQQLVCLTSSHVNCPRYLHGSLPAPAPVQHAPPARVVTPAIAASIALLIVAFLLSVAFVVANGGLVLTAAETNAPASDAVPAETASPPPTASAASTSAAAAVPSPTAAATSTVAAGRTPDPTPGQTATPAPTPLASPPGTPAPTTTPTPRPSSGRYALLTACPDEPNCYIYQVRRGDNIFSIASYFGVSIATVQAWNPWTADGLTVGRGLRIPPPTR